MGFFDILKTVASPIASLVGIGGDIASGAANRNQASQQFQQQFDFQRDLSRKGVQYRIDDTVAAAKKHKFHPYALLNQQPYNASPIYTGGQQSTNFGGAGQNIGKSIERALDPTGRKHRELQNELLESQIKNVDARTAAINPNPPIPTADPLIVDEVYGNKVPTGKVTIGKMKQVWPDAPGAGKYEVSPPKVATHKKGLPGIRTGENPAYQEFILPGGLPIQLPGTEEGSYSEALEAIPKWKWMEVLGYNSDFYGDGWFTDWLGFATLGNPPRKKYKRAKFGKTGNKRSEMRRKLYKFK